MAAATVLVTGHALAATIPAPRTGKFAGYSRVVLDVPEGVKWTLEPMGAALRLTFPGQKATKASAKLRQPELGGWTLDAGQTAAVLNIITPQGVSKRSGFRASTLAPSDGKKGSRLVIDLSGAFADISPLPAVGPLVFRKAFGRAFKVVVDAGHGGTDMGAIGFVTERPLNLDVAQRVAARLREAGVNVIMTREDNGTISENKRADLSARAQMSVGADAFVSIHANSTVRSRVNSTFGMEVYYFNPSRHRPMMIASGPEPVAQPIITETITSTPAPTTETSPPDSGVTSSSASGVPAGAVNPTPTAADATIGESGTNPNADPNAGPDTASSTASSTDPITDPSSTPPPETPPTELSVQAPVSLAVNFKPFTAERAQQSQALAINVLSHALGATAASNGGVRTDSFVVIRESVCPAILVEMGYVKHPVEGIQLRNTHYLDRIAYGIAWGVIEYLENAPDPR
jgi:N-acetylmuramoyl-L-alanine amidase